MTEPGEQRSSSLMLVDGDSVTLTEAGSSHSQTYRRSADGEKIHLAECRHIVGRGSAWPFADGMSHRDICELMIRAPWLRPCRVCQPDVPEEYR